jgi:hypothetical protein
MCLERSGLDCAESLVHATERRALSKDGEMGGTSAEAREGDGERGEWEVGGWGVASRCSVVSSISCH